MEKFYLTAAIPYINAKPHLGHALEFVEGDVLARYHRSLGEAVKYASGTDENSLKNVQAAEKEGITVQVLADRNYGAFQDLAKKYNISFDAFMRSSSKEHFASSAELWKLCEKSGDIYKKQYKGLYCIGCEAFYTTEELTPEGECPLHPGKKLETIEEENYFFRLSKYEKELTRLIETDEYKIIPETRKNETLGFIKKGLEDFSVSRSVARARGWGVPVPGDETQMMYVWFDALNVYRSAAPDWWPANLHLIGKDILRFHSVYWPGILLSAKLPLPKKLLVHGFITLNGQKMSKSLGNVVDPFELVEKYGVDPVRYYLLREIPSTDDGDFSFEKFEIRYNADLANGLGNFAARTSTLAAKVSPLKIVEHEDEVGKIITETKNTINQCLDDFKLNEALAAVSKLISFGDEYVNKHEIWKHIEEPKGQTAITNTIGILEEAAEFLKFFLPETAGKILDGIKKENNSINVSPISNLFPRLK